ncbi:MAG: chromosomal replication initiator protein DnaA [Bacteroidaceae bacterium]|nr:chromosomal replication initiator protein DnaA [Bacteroidaceae bacterium]
MSESSESKWQICLENIRANIPAAMFSTWFVSVAFSSCQHDELTLSVPNMIVRNFIEEHYNAVLRQAVNEVFGEKTKISFVQRSVADNTPKSVLPDLTQQENILPPLDPQLNHRYTFENFVEGQSNKLAFTVATAIANNPNQATFNPLFIYGPSGVGKTHLANAIGIRVRERFPKKRVLFVPINVFQTQYTHSVKQNRFNDFMAFYQSIEVLIIDDIQELTTPKTQQVFFHIFNNLQQNNRHIIITSDRSPAQLEGMDERMLSRFKWGMTAEIERPDMQLRKGILISKSYKDGQTLSEDVIDFVAQHVTGSVRELEGVINSMMAYSIVDNCDIDIKLAAKVIARTVSMNESTLTADDVMQATAKYYGVKTKDLVSKARTAQIANARQVAMYLCKKHLEMAYTQIGKKFGKRDHSTVLHSCNQVTVRMSVDKVFRHEVEEIETSLKKN